MASVARHHAEWLSLLEVSGPFLSMEVLQRAFPQELDKHDPELRARLALAYAEWDEDRSTAVQRAWIRFVLRELLELPDDAFAEGQTLPPGLEAKLPEHDELLRPDLAIVNPPATPNAGKPRILVQTYPAGTHLERPVSGKRWVASPVSRMIELLHSTGTRLGLATDGERWALVHAPQQETTTVATFYASLWLEEPLTLRAFRALLGARRHFGVAAEDTLESMLERSAANQQEVTDQLGLQVRHAVELLVDAFDRLDRDRGRKLLAGIEERELYQAALSVMMRLVFLFAAEERELLPIDSPIYQTNYAVSSIREELRRLADQHGEEVLERRHDAWARLLATFRAVHGGVRHDLLALPAYGGSLFDPDRYPFLEGRAAKTAWRESAAEPLAIDNRTVLHLLEALQVLQVRIPGGGAEPRRVSFRALDIEQIGHVYEGLLDHTAVRARGVVLGLEGAKGLEPEVPLADLESRSAKGADALVEFLEEQTGRSEKALRKALEYPNELDDRRWLVACETEAVYGKVKPYASLVRKDDRDYPIVKCEGAVYVTQGSDRRSTGTHYTPRSLTEPIVRYTLEPLVYEGPAEGKTREEWRLRPARELLSLRVCDMAMGSGAFLVEACRYLSARLVESWDEAEKRNPGRIVISPDGELSAANPAERVIPIDREERLTIARRVVADRCLFGVDVNPMAVEMAKLSLWLATVQKDRPFTFLDHALRCGDSLLGITAPEQIEQFHLDPARGKEIHSHLFNFTKVCAPALERAIKLRNKLESFAVNDIRDAKEKQRLLNEALAASADVRLLGDLIVGAALTTAADGPAAFEEKLRSIAPTIAEALDLAVEPQRRAVARADLTLRAQELLHAGRKARTPFHWAIEFPEVFSGAARGFSAFIGNPPFLKGHLISNQLGHDYRSLISSSISRCSAGLSDIVVFFLLRAAELVSSPGTLGYIVTNTASEGDSRRVGLDQLVTREMTLTRADANIPWPGDAAVIVHRIFLSRGGWRGTRVLNGRPQETLDPSLHEIARQDRMVLAENESLAFNGVYPNGEGFLVAPQTAAEWVASDSRNADVLHPYITGQELYEKANPLPERSIICFWDWEQRDAAARSLPWKQVAGTVQEQRRKVSRDRTRERWWIFAENRPGLAHAIGFGKFFCSHPKEWRRDVNNLERVIVKTKTSRTWAFLFMPSAILFDQTVIVIASDSLSVLGAVQSSHHFFWALEDATNHKTDMRYSPQLFETFPRPHRTVSERVVQAFLDCRNACARERNKGLTDLCHLVNNAKCADADIARLRELHRELDLAVSAAYDWSDLNLSHGFHETKQGTRFTINETARQELLRRMLTLNEDRYAAEAKLGLHEETKPKKRSSTSAKQPQLLFDTVTDASTTSPTSPNAGVNRLRFRIVNDAPREDRYRSCIPISDIRAAAGGFSDGQLPSGSGWAEIRGEILLKKGMFVAQISGESMVPLIPKDAWCVFKRGAPSKLHGKVWLIQLHDAPDAETGGRFTVKRVRQQKEGDALVAYLDSENPKFPPRRFDEASGDSLSPIAEFVCVLDLEATESSADAAAADAGSRRRK